MIDPMTLLPIGSEGATPRLPDPPVDRMFILRLAVLLGTDYATARDWAVAKIAIFRGVSEGDVEALIRD